MTALILFDFDSGSCRFGRDDDGTPWVVASDFAKLMGYRDARDAARLLDNSDRGTQIVRTPGGDQQMTVFYEDGIWELIFRSTLPGAKAIKARVKAILREIRETGRYGEPPLPDITTPAGVLAMAERFATTARQLVAAEARNAELLPKAEAHDAYMAARGGHLIREVTKAFRQEWPGLRVHELFNFLVAERLIFRRSGAVCGTASYDAHAEYVPVHFLVTTQDVVHRRDATPCAHTTVHVTPRGIELIRKRMTERFGRAS